MFDKVLDKVGWRRWGGSWGVLVVLSSYCLLTLTVMKFDPYCKPYCAVLAVLSGVVDGSEPDWQAEPAGPKMFLPRRG